MKYPYCNNKKTGLVISLFVTFLFICSSSFSSVYRNYEYSHKLPDGTTITLIVNGGKYYARTETPDGYTVVFDNKKQRYFYAMLSKNGNELISSGIPYDGKKAHKTPPMKKHLDINKAAKLHIVKQRRQEEINREANLFIKKSSIRDNRSGQYMSQSNLVGTLTSLTILIDFSDDVATMPIVEVDSYLNQLGYSQNNNSGSVKDYWLNSSGGLLNYHNNLVGYYRASQPKSYYTAATNYDRARELVGEALQYYINSGYDFSTLTKDPNNHIMSINVFYAGASNSPWGQGLWPHAGGKYIQIDSTTATNRYQMTPMNSVLYIGMFCHEVGHMIGGYPDLYDYQSDSSGIGTYGLMAYQSARAPLPPNPYLRFRSNWETVVELNPAVNISAPSGTLHDMTSDTNSYRYSNPNNPNESFFIESAFRDTKGQSFPDEGLLVWHVDSGAGNNNCQDMTPACHYYISVEQADGLFHLENNMGAGADDLFHFGNNFSFSDFTLPNANWWDGTSSGLNIVDVGPVEANMCFAVDSGSCPHPNLTPIVNINGPYNGTTNAPVQFLGEGSYDPDGTIALYDWQFGDGSSGTTQNPTHTYTSAGTYTVTLRVIDNLGASSATVSTTVTITDDGLANACLTEGPDDYVQLYHNTPICVVDGYGYLRYFYFHVDPGITQIRIRTGHGTGNADLYYSYSVWPSPELHHDRSTNPDNFETILFSYPPVGWNYISIDGTHQGLTLQVDMQ